MNNKFTKLMALTLILTLILSTTSLSFADTNSDESIGTKIDNIIENVDKIATAINKTTDVLKVAFNDLNNHWALKYVTSLIDINIVKGYPDGTFKPDGYITVAEFTKILMLNNQIELGDEGSNWYDKYINGARDVGLIQGGEIKDYNKLITRAEMVRLISRALNLTEVKDKEFSDEREFKLFSDDVLKVVNIGIVEGYADGSFKPYAGATRAEACTMISRVNTYLDGKKVVPSIVTPEYNLDGSWTDEWFLDNIDSMWRSTNFHKEYYGNYYFEDGKLHHLTTIFGDERDIAVEDKVQNDKLYRLIKLFVQRAVETNRYARVAYIQNDGEKSDLTRIDFTVEDRGMLDGYLNIDIPVYPETYLDTIYLNDYRDNFKDQEIEVIWRFDKMVDNQSFPPDLNIALESGRRREILEANQYILEPYRDVLYKSGEILYGDDSKEVIDHIVKERVKEIKIFDYESYEYKTFGEIILQQSNSSTYSGQFFTTLKE